MATSARRRYPRTPARWATDAARALGLRPMTVESLVHGRRPVHLTTAEIVRAAVRWGDPALAGKVLAPILAAQHDQPEITVDEALVPAQEADAAEEVAQTRYQQTPTAAHRRAFLDASRAQLATTAQLIRALEVEELLACE